MLQQAQKDASGVHHSCNVGDMQPLEAALAWCGLL